MLSPKPRGCLQAYRRYFVKDTIDWALLETHRTDLMLGVLVVRLGCEVNLIWSPFGLISLTASQSQLPPKSAHSPPWEVHHGLWLAE
jgi:hypothetical protein